MNKQTKRLVSMLAVFAMLVCTLAGTISQSKSVNAATTEVLIPAKVVDFQTLPTPATKTVTVPGSNGNDSATSDSTAVIIPIQMDYNGVLRMALTASGLDSALSYCVYSDEACTQPLNTAYSLTSGYPSEDLTITIDKAGKYFLKLAWRYTVLPAVGATVVVEAFAYSGAEVTLTSEYQSIFTNDTATSYHKLEVASDSLVTVYGNSYSPSGDPSSLYVDLCNSNKVKILSSTLTSYSQYVAQYALSKGTYYISTNESDRYQLKCTMGKVKDQSASSKGKATQIKKGKTVKGIITLSEKTSKADWYKIKLTKSAKIKLLLSAQCSGYSSLKVQFIPASSKTRMLSDTVYIGTGSKTASTTKMKKGTYYLKVTKRNATDSGSYSIKYK